MKYLIIFISLISCGKSNVDDKIAQEIYLSHLEVIENLLDGKEIQGNSSVQAISFLEALTDIKSHTDEDSIADSVKDPNNHNLNDWKKWFELNKDKLYWDKKTENVKIKGKPTRIIKDPMAEYQKHLNTLKQSITGDTIFVDEINYSIGFFSKLTGLNDYEIDHDCRCLLPNQDNIKALENWLQENNNNLVWDGEQHKVRLKK